MIRTPASGNEFREWVNMNKTPDEIAGIFSGFTDDSLGTTGSHTNRYIRKAYSAWGQEWLLDAGLIRGQRQQRSGDRGGRFVVHPEFHGKGRISANEREALENGEEVGWLHICTTTQCAQYVSDTLTQEQVTGNAWHRHRPGSLSYSAFSNLGQETIQSIEELFSEMNSEGPSSSYNDRVADIVQSLVPSQQQFSNLKLGDIVGLYHHSSRNHAKAFFEGATGRKDWGSGPAVRGTGFVGWSPEKLGTPEPFSLGPNTSRTGFGMNSHVGFVGAINSRGVPIVFHNVGGKVSST